MLAVVACRPSRSPLADRLVAAGPAGAKHGAAAVVLSPEEMAHMELDKLVASGLAEPDVKQFYVELTTIVRRYIERTTGIRARADHRGVPP